MSIKQALEHPWIKKYSKKVVENRFHSPVVTQFKVYSHHQPDSPKIKEEVAKRGKEDFGGY